MMRAIWTDGFGRQVESWVFAEFTGTDDRQMIVVQHWNGDYWVIERDDALIVALKKGN